MTERLDQVRAYARIRLLGQSGSESTRAPGITDPAERKGRIPSDLGLRIVE